MTYTFSVTNGHKQVHSLDVTAAESLRHALSTALTWIEDYREKVNPRARITVTYAKERWQVVTLRRGYVWIERPNYGQWAHVDTLSS